MAIRRAGKRWREGAPDNVVDCFYHPKFVDAYTIFVKFDDERVGYLGTNASLSFSGWSDMSNYDASRYRYENGHYRIKWLDVPEKVREAVIQDTTTTEGK
jgi:hypothetical protein